jgi:hypothetical protein
VHGDRSPSGVCNDCNGSARRVSEGKEGWEVFEGRAAIGYDHGYEAQKFYLGQALDPKYVEGFVEGCLERIGEDDPDGEMFLQAGRGDLFFDVRPQQNVVLNEG